MSGAVARDIDYAGASYDEAEIEAVVEVLRTSIRVGPKVAAFESAVAEAFGKAHGVMVNSGSSALQVAYELLRLEPGDEVLTPAVTFSTTVAPAIRLGLVPAFVDVEADTCCVDVDQLESMVTDRTRAVVVPNLAGNVPDWDRIRGIADRHDLLVVEDSCDTFGATLRGTPTGTRADITVTSFAMSHIVTAAGNGGMVMVDRDDWWDEALLLRRWGRSSEPRFHGTRRDERGRFLAEVDGMRYDALFVFELAGHNFEPSEIGAAFGLVQLTRLPELVQRRRHNVARHDAFFGSHPELFGAPRQLPEVETAWLQYPLRIRATAPFSRADFQAHMKRHGISTRMVWTGNVLRQPMMRGVEHRAPAGGCPNADAIMERGVLLPCHQTMDDDDLEHVHDAVRSLIDERV